MVVGIDVYHDKSRKMGSIAGVVASLNDSLSRYFSTVAIQKQGQEIIDALKIAFMQSLIRYVLHTGKSLSEALRFEEHVVLNVRNDFCTHVLPRFELGLFNEQ